MLEHPIPLHVNQQPYQVLDWGKRYVPTYGGEPIRANGALEHFRVALTANLVLEMIIKQGPIREDGIAGRANPHTRASFGVIVGVLRVPWWSSSA